MDALTVTAPTFTCAGDEVVTCAATAPVAVDIPSALHAEADRATLVTEGDTRTLTLTRGWMQRPGSERVDFDTATLTEPASGAPQVLWTGLTAPMGQGKLSALSAQTTLSPGAPWSASTLTFAPCACTDGKDTAVTISAREATVEPAFLLVKGGVVRVFRVPVLPLPALRIPLAPNRFHLLLPELGYGTPGFSAAVLGQGGVDGWTLTGGPAWREDRGFRGEIAAKGPGPGTVLGGSGSAALGWDGETGSVRGAVASTAGVDRPGGLRTAWEGAWQSDASYAEDYGPDWVARGLPREEQRAVVGLGIGRLAIHGVTDSTDAVAPLEMVQTRLRKEWSENPNSRTVATVGLRGALAGWGSSWDALRPLLSVGADSHGAWSGGPLRMSGAVDGELRALDEADVQGLGTGSATAEVPMYTGRLQLWPGLYGTGRVRATPNAITGATTEEHGFVGVGSRADLVSGPWLLSGEAHVGQDELGWTARGSAALDGPVHLAVRAGRRQQGGEIGLSTTPASLSAGVVHALAADGTETLLTWGSADLRLHRARLGGSMSTPVGVPALWTARAFAGYDDGCSSLLVTAALSPDRALPDFGLKLQVRR